MERDIAVNLVNVVEAISTHTLTWSVTNCFDYLRQCIYISTHTLTWSVTSRYS